MKTVKEVSKITGLSIRTLRYYDEIGLLVPTQLTEAGYRLYDHKALEKLQTIMFYRELEMPLVKIKEMIENPTYDREQALFAQEEFLKRKQNHLNGIIELINDMKKGVHTMNFDVLSDDEVRQILDHSLMAQGEESIEAILERFGSPEAFRDFLTQRLKDERMSIHLNRMYGGKEKVIKASLQVAEDAEVIKAQQVEIDKIYKQFAVAMKTENASLAEESVRKLAESYKLMFKIDNARYLLLEVAKDYLNLSPLEEATDCQYGKGITKYIGQAIQLYYGI